MINAMTDEGLGTSEFMTSTVIVTNSSHISRISAPEGYYFFDIFKQFSQAKLMTDTFFWTSLSSAKQMLSFISWCVTYLLLRQFCLIIGLLAPYGDIDRGQNFFGNGLLPEDKKPLPD